MLSGTYLYDSSYIGSILNAIRKMIWKQEIKMATDPNSIIESASELMGNHEHLNPNRSNDGNSGSPPTNPEIEPGNTPDVDPEPIGPEIDPFIEPEIEPGKIPDDTLIPQK
jgi:hypothetical protein